LGDDFLSAKVLDWEIRRKLPFFLAALVLQEMNGLCCCGKTGYRLMFRLRMEEGDKRESRYKGSLNDLS
jgi:hypothetical protein